MKPSSWCLTAGLFLFVAGLYGLNQGCMGEGAVYGFIVLGAICTVASLLAKIPRV